MGRLVLSLLLRLCEGIGLPLVWPPTLSWASGKGRALSLKVCAPRTSDDKRSAGWVRATGWK